MGSLFGVKINKSLDPFSGSYGKTGDISGFSDLDPEALVGGALTGLPGDKGLYDKYSWKGLYDQEIAKGKSESEARKAARAAAAEAEARRPKTKAQEGVIDYSKLQKTLKQMQAVKGKAISPDIMKSLLGGAVKGQVEPAIAREEKAMDRAIQQKRLDIQTKQQEDLIKAEERQAQAGFVGDAISLVDAITVLCTELNRQGLLDIQVIERANKYRRKNIDKAVYEGYLMWATPLVEIMKVSPLVTKFVCFFWKPLTYELASRGNKRKGSLFGKVSYGILSPFSRLVYFCNQKEVEECQV
jgi:hypothetical protein